MIDIETSKAIRAQMLRKVQHYRSILRHTLSSIRGNVATTEWINVRKRIKNELSIPEWEVLGDYPLDTVMHQDPNEYRSIKIGPTSINPDELVVRKKAIK